MKLTQNSWVSASEITSREIYDKVIEKFIEAGVGKTDAWGNFEDVGKHDKIGLAKNAEFIFNVSGEYIINHNLKKVSVKDLLEESNPEVKDQQNEERINVSLTPYEAFFLHNLVGQTASSVSPQICLMLSDSLSDYLEYDFDFIDYDTMYSEFGTINLWELQYDLEEKWKVILETAQQSKQEKISELESKISSLQEELNNLKQN